MCEVRAHGGHSIEYFIFERFALRTEGSELKLAKTLFRKVVAAHQVQELVGYPGHAF